MSIERHAVHRPRRSRALLALVLVTLVAACGKSVDDLERYARLYHERGDHMAAIESWTEAIEREPRLAHLYVGRGLSYRASKQYEEARHDFVRAVDCDSALDEARFLEAETFRDELRFDDALAVLDAAEGGAVVRRTRLAGLIRRDRARHTMNDLLAAAGSLGLTDQGTFWRALSVVDLDSAASYLERQEAPGIVDLIERLRGAREDLAVAEQKLSEASTETGREAAEALCDLADFDLMRERPDAAAERLTALLGTQPEHQVELRARRILADAAEMRGDLVGALEQMTKAVESDDTDVDLRFGRAMLFLKLGRTDEARPDIAVVAAAPFRVTQAKLLDGILKLQSGDSDGAVADFQYVAASAPGAALSHLWLGLALSATSDRHDAALAALGKAVAIDPQFTIGHLARSAVATQAGWWDDAVKHAERCTQLAPSGAAGWLVLGEALVRRGAATADVRRRDADFQAAARALAQAMQLDPSGVSGQEAIVMRNAITGRVADGIGALRKALAENREPDLLVTLADLLFADQQSDEAMRCLRDAVEAEPGHVRAVRALSSALVERGLADEATDVLESALRARDGDGESARIFAEHLAANGDPIRARVVLRNAATKNPRHRGVAVARFQLAAARHDLAEMEEACVAGMAIESGLRPFHQAGGLAAMRGDLATAFERLSTSVERFPTDTNLLAMHAIVAARHGRQEAALTSARAVMERAATNPTLIAVAALAMRKAGDPDGARTQLNESLSLSRVAARAVRSHLDLASESDAHLETLLDVHLSTLAAGPGAPGAPLTDGERGAETLLEGDGREDVLLVDLVGNGLLARGEAAGAAALYKRLLDVEPSLHGAREKLAVIRADTGDRDGALDELKALFRGGSGSPSAHALAGALYEERGDLTNARRHLERALELNDRHAGVAARLAHVLERVGNASRAITLWERAVALDPGHPAANARLAELLASREPSRAETLARRAVGAAPRSGFARRALAFVLLESGRIPNALIEIEKAAMAVPDDPRLWSLRGSALFGMGRTADAREALLKAVEIDPDDHRPYVQLGMLDEIEGELSSAQTWYEVVIELDPRHAIALNNLAAVIAKQKGDLDVARAYAERAVAESAGSGDMLDTLGWIQFQQGNAAQAVTTLRQAIGVDPDDLSTRFHLAVALANAGRDAESLRELELLSMAGEFPEAAAAAKLRRELMR